MATETSGLAERYAAALYDLAESAQQLDVVAGDLRALRATIAESEDLSRALGARHFKREQQSAAALEVAKLLGLADLTQRFIGVVARNGRSFALSDIAKAYLAELARRRGETTVQVTSAQPLSDDQVARVTETLRRSLGAAVAVDQKVDQSLIGGMVVRIGSKLVDHSLKTKLMRLQLAMKGVG